MCVLNYVECHYTCLDCFGSEQNQCLTCVENRDLLDQFCACQQGYFDLQESCNKCHYSCVSCSSSGPNNCIDCNIYNLRLFENRECKCNSGYVDIGYPQCEACPSDCEDCDPQQNCVSCKFQNYVINQQGPCDCPIGQIQNIDNQCVDCQAIEGRMIQQCQYKNSSDGVWTYGEQCDDQNVIKAKLLESGNQTNNIQLEILYYEFDINQMNIKIEYFNINEDYKFTTNLINQNKFEIQFTFTKPIKQFNIIHIYLPIKQQRRLLDYSIREYQFTPIEVDYYDVEQISQRQSIQNTQQQFYKSIAYLGPITLILGGTSFFLQILDIISWINNFYYININYPGNVQIFFEKANWGLIIDNIQQIIVIGLTLIVCISISMRIIKFTKIYQNRNKQVISQLQNDLIRQQSKSIQQVQKQQQLPQVPQLPQQQNIQKWNNRLIQKLLFELQRFYDNRYLIVLETLNTSILDIALAIIINLKYQNYFNDFILFISFLFFNVFIILSLIFLYFIYIIISAHNILKKIKVFRNITKQLFEGLKQDKISRLYGLQAIFQKTLFIVSVVVYYERPLLQTLTCSSILMGLIMISIYQYPYSNYKDILSQFIPDVSLAFILLLCCLLAADEQINYFTYQQRYTIGWVMLAINSLSIIIQLIFMIKEECQQIFKKIKWIKSLIKK